MVPKFLTVDDSKTIRLIVKRAFEDYDCEVYEAENGASGLTMAKKIMPDLIILDLTMPVMNGIEMLEKMRMDASLRDIAVIMLTAESGKDNVIRILRMGVKDYIVKPFRGDQLIERVKKLVSLHPKSSGKGEGEDQELGKILTKRDQILEVKLRDKLMKEVNVKIVDTLRRPVLWEKVKECHVDLREVVGVNMMLIKLIVEIVDKSRELGVSVKIICSRELETQLSELLEFSSLVDYARA